MNWPIFAVTYASPGVRIELGLIVEFPIQDFIGMPVTEALSVVAERYREFETDIRKEACAKKRSTLTSLLRQHRRIVADLESML